MTTQRRKKEHDNAGDGADEDSESANEARAGVEESSSKDGWVVVSRKSGKKECPVRSGRNDADLREDRKNSKTVTQDVTPSDKVMDITRQGSINKRGREDSMYVTLEGNVLKLSDV